jgi:DNA-binding XRE family transcriptional regulator
MPNDLKVDKANAMTPEEFLQARQKLKKTQKQMSQLLGASIKAIHSYEQGWRKIPGHVERQVYFLLSRIRNKKGKVLPCWLIKKCPPSRKRQCPAWEFRTGDLCWFINGTICECNAQESWQKKMDICRSCEVLKNALA